MARAKSEVTLLVGHQPTIGRLVSVLLHGVEQDLPVKKILDLVAAAPHA